MKVLEELADGGVGGNLVGCAVHAPNARIHAICDQYFTDLESVGHISGGIVKHGLALPGNSNII